MTNDAHARPSGDTPEPLYDVNVPTPTHAERARALVSRITTGTLCTLAAEPEGYPYGSFVTVGFDAGNPVFLVSTMAEHTQNLQRDPRGSLLVAEREADDPLANGRVTLLGPCTRVEGDGGSARAAFLGTHPNAAYYVDFGDFAFWRLRVESVRFIGGYGRMSWVEASDWHAAEADPLAASAAGVVAHMNDDHADAMEENGTRTAPVFGSLWHTINADDAAGAGAPHITIAVPGATADSLGIPAGNSSTLMWIMDPGTTTAHLMLPGR